MKKKIFIHIGTHKTGTTAVQLFSTRNINDLKKFDIHYASETRPEKAYIKFGHHLLPWFLMERHSQHFGKYENQKEALIPALISEIKASSCSNIILSSEVFTMLNLKQINKLKEYFLEFDVHIISYFRRKDIFIETMYQTNVMNYRESRSLNDCMTKMGVPLNYYTFVKNWQDVFGKENVHVRLYSKTALKMKNIVVDFYNYFGIDIVDILKRLDDEKINASVPFQYADLIAHLRRIGASDNIVQEVKRVSRVLGDELEGQYHFLPLSTRLELARSGYTELEKLNLTFPDNESFLTHEQDSDISSEPNKIEVFKNIIKAFNESLKSEAEIALEKIQIDERGA